MQIRLLIVYGEETECIWLMEDSQCTITQFSVRQLLIRGQSSNEVPWGVQSLIHYLRVTGQQSYPKTICILTSVFQVLTIDSCINQCFTVECTINYLIRTAYASFRAIIV